MDYVLQKCKTYITCDSHVVPHRSTEQAQGCLTSEFGWDPVLSPWYERMMGDRLVVAPPIESPDPHKRPRTSGYTKARVPSHSHTFSAFWLRSSVVSVLNEVTFVTSPLDSSEAITDILWFRGGTACIHPTSWPQPCTNSWGRGTNQYIENDSMAQRQRVGFQIQRLGVRIPLGSFLPK